MCRKLFPAAVLILAAAAALGPETASPAAPSYVETVTIPLQDVTRGGVAAGPNDLLFVAHGTTFAVFRPDGDVVRRVELPAEAGCLAVDDDGRAYIGMIDHIEVYGPEGGREAIWPGLGRRARITAVAVQGGDVFVSDAGNRLVVRFSSAGRLEALIGKTSESDYGDHFVVPSPYFDVAAAGDGNIWAANPGRHRLERFHRTGRLVRWWGKASARPEGFCGCCNPAALAVMADGSLVTGEKGIIRVRRYTPEGRFIGLVAGPECFDPDTKGIDLAVDSRNRIIVLDPERNAVRIFEEEKPRVGR